MSKDFSALSGFSRRDGALYCEELNLRELALRFGTPLYVYSHQALKTALENWMRGIAGTNHRVFYAMKANSNLALLKFFHDSGTGFDIVSRGELQRALMAGAKGNDIVYSGVGKSREDIRAALRADIGCFNVESIPELDRINEVALEEKRMAPVSVRVNPDVDAKTHPYISTGLKNNKFGVSYDQTVALYQRAATLPGIRISGIDMHIGSQITELEPFVHAADKIFDIVDALAQNGIMLDHLDFGGGLGVRYTDETPPSAETLVKAVSRKAAERGYADLPIYFEPGRSLVARAGILLTTVEYLKPTEAKNFMIVDAAMNDMVRPTLYQAQMPLVNCTQRDEANLWDVVGPVCKTGDFLARSIELAAQPGDVLAMTGAGAYGMSMASNYNSRGRAAEVLVSGTRVWLIRRRETIEDLMALENTVPTDAFV